MTGPTVEQVGEALARHLHDAGAAIYNPDATYPATTTAPAVFFGQLYDAPGLAVAVNHYYSHPDPMIQQGSPRMRFQLRWRGDRDPRTVHRIADAAYDVLHTLTPGSWPGGVRTLWCVRQIVAPIEPDENGRWERADSYEIQLNPLTIGA